MAIVGAVHDGHAAAAEFVVDLVGGGEQVLEFTPASKDERKDDPDGKCSHFVATASWMKADDALTVIVVVEIDNKKERIEWKGFSPKQFAHVDE